MKKVFDLRKKYRRAIFNENVSSNQIVQLGLLEAGKKFKKR